VTCFDHLITYPVHRHSLLGKRVEAIMIHLREDSPSSFSRSFRSRHQISMNPGKRPRSPEGSSLADRPSKRPSLAIGGISRCPDYRPPNLNLASSSSWGTSEDWVQQAGGLSIDSPIFRPPDRDNRFAQQAETHGGDVDMMDSEESSVNERLGRAQSAPLHFFLFSNPGPPEQMQQQPPTLVPQTPHRHQPGTRLAERSFANVNIPLVNVVPATSINQPEAPEVHASSVGRNSSEQVYSEPQSSTPPPTSLIPMAISPTTSFTQIGSSRRRVMFGPRANCDKCRLGAPGHFAHYE